jgi:hypothetical protein
MITHMPRPVKDFDLEVAEGNIPGVAIINKFGFAPNCDAGIPTDIWSGADVTYNQATWLAPTAPRIHGIVSTSLADSAAGGVNPVGVGAHVVRVTGLVDWDSKESTEDVTLDGTTSVNTVNSYVIIHRMKVITTAATATTTNVGRIVATAAVDGTKTALIDAGFGQSMMSIYGIPSTQDMYLKNYYIAILKGAASVGAELSLMYCEDPENRPAIFLTKEITGIASEGSNSYQSSYLPSKQFIGPGIIKVRANASANDVRISANFGAFLLDKV